MKIIKRGIWVWGSAFKDPGDGPRHNKRRVQRKPSQDAGKTKVGRKLSKVLDKILCDC